MKEDSVEGEGASAALSRSADLDNVAQLETAREKIVEFLERRRAPQLFAVLLKEVRAAGRRSARMGGNDSLDAGERGRRKGGMRRNGRCEDEVKSYSAKGVCELFASDGNCFLRTGCDTERLEGVEDEGDVVVGEERGKEGAEIHRHLVSSGYWSSCSGGYASRLLSGRSGRRGRRGRSFSSITAPSESW